MAVVSIQTMPIMMTGCDVFGARHAQVEYSLMWTYEEVPGDPIDKLGWEIAPLGEDVPVHLPGWQPISPITPISPISPASHGYSTRKTAGAPSRSSHSQGSAFVAPAITSAPMPQPLHITVDLLDQPSKPTRFQRFQRFLGLFVERGR